MYDDELGRAIVMEPLAALARSEARVLIDFLCSELSRSRIEFYSLDKGHYRVVDAGSLKFISSDKVQPNNQMDRTPGCGAW
jgi:hypothetical protein